MARKSKLMQVVKGDILRYLGDGMTVKDTCALVGIPEQTYHRWCNTNREFCESAMRARVQGRRGAVAIVRAAMFHTFRDEASGKQIPTPQATEAAKWYLERSDPESWARRTYARIEGLDELLKLCERKGVNASDLFDAMIAELAIVSADSSEAGG